MRRTFGEQSVHTASDDVSFGVALCSAFSSTLVECASMVGVVVDVNIANTIVRNAVGAKEDLM